MLGVGTVEAEIDAARGDHVTIAPAARQRLRRAAGGGHTGEVQEGVVGRLAARLLPAFPREADAHEGDAGWMLARSARARIRCARARGDLQHRYIGRSDEPTAGVVDIFLARPPSAFRDVAAAAEVLLPGTEVLRLGGGLEGVLRGDDANRAGIHSERRVAAAAVEPDIDRGRSRQVGVSRGVGIGHEYGPRPAKRVL